ncbi:hypothetical protein AB6A40_006773 [Gnathostoma spinigerum]|uniref:ZP domain-containing protein n=1 Tax=Gnathostoma spinigerum TaxID=75299 RepID=A0ABD6EPH3_9BILA
MKKVTFLICFLITTSDAIPIDNGIEGVPEVDCTSDSITVNFNTHNTFEGSVSVKGAHNRSACRSTQTGQPFSGITIPFDGCNVIRTRSLNPRGVYLTTTVIISFHPQFVTKIDRAYRIQCFYMEADKTVSTQIDVSDMSTIFQTRFVPMPICRYEVSSLHHHSHC